MSLHSTKILENIGLVTSELNWGRNKWKYCCNRNLARSAKLLTRLYILLASISFFSSSSASFLMFSRRQIILGYAGPIFTIFSPYESTLRADDGYHLQGEFKGERDTEGVELEVPVAPRARYGVGRWTHPPHRGWSLGRESGKGAVPPPTAPPRKFFDF